MSRPSRLGLLLLFAITACSNTDTTDVPVAETATPAQEITSTVELPTNDRLRTWGVERILADKLANGNVRARLVDLEGTSLATMNLMFEAERSLAHIQGTHGALDLDLVASDAMYSMHITDGELTWFSTRETILGEPKVYEKVSSLGYLAAFSDLILALKPAPAKPYDAALWGEHLKQGCWAFPDGAALGCAAALPALALDLATINWSWSLCSPLCYGAGLAPPSAIGCFGCIGANLALIGLSWQMWSAIYPEQCRRACLNGCFGEFPPMPDYTCGRAGRHEAPPKGMACADGLVKCCGTYCEYPTVCSAQSASQGDPAALGASCGTMNVVTEGVAYPTCSVVSCAQGWCDDPDRDGVGSCVNTQPQPPSATWQTDVAQPVVKTQGSAVTVNCSNPTAFGDQCRATSLRNVKTTYSRCWLCGYWTCGDIWDANKDVPERAWCDMLAANCVTATVDSCATNNICGGGGQACCNTGGGNRCSGGLACTVIDGQQRCDE